MKVLAAILATVLFVNSHAKVTKSNRGADERQLMQDMDTTMELEDSKAITDADMRMVSLVNAVNRLKVKLQRELQTTVSYLRYHFNQRDAFDKRIMMQVLASKAGGAAAGRKERMLVDQPMLKNYGRIDDAAKQESFDVVRPPVEPVLTEVAPSAPLVPIAPLVQP